MSKIKNNFFVKFSFSVSLVIIILSGLVFENNFLFSNILPSTFGIIFADLITIVQSISELKSIYSDGSDKISSTELYGRPMNYPDIWVYVFSFLKLFGNPVYIFGYFQILLYIIFSKFILFKNLNYFYLFFFIIFSPPLLLLLERGNNDLIIFFILYLSIIFKNYLSGILFGISISLKIFPIVLLPFFLLFNNFNKKFIFGFLAMTPLVYWALINIQTSINNTDVVASFGASFGLYSLSMFTIKFFQEIYNSELFNISLFYLNALFFSLFLILSLIFYKVFEDNLNSILNNLEKNEKDIKIFILLTILTLSVFFAFSNYAYRLIFLLLPLLILFKTLKNIDSLSFIKKNIFLFLSSIPFLSPWLVLSFNETAKNHHIWVLFSLITFLSFILYFCLVICFLRNKIKAMLNKRD